MFYLCQEGNFLLTLKINQNSECRLKVSEATKPCIRELLTKSSCLVVKLLENVSNNLTIIL